MVNGLHSSTRRTECLQTLQTRIQRPLAQYAVVIDDHPLITY
jgi:hypothetical protein